MLAIALRLAIASSNRCLTSSNKKLLETSALLVVGWRIFLGLSHMADKASRCRLRIGHGRRSEVGRSSTEFQPHGGSHQKGTEDVLRLVFSNLHLKVVYIVLYVFLCSLKEDGYEL